MVGPGEDPQTWNCPSCGALLHSDVEEQFYCEYCGSPLPSRGPGEDAAHSVPYDQEETIWKQEEEEILDWLAHAASPSAQDASVPTKRIELRPTAAPTFESEVAGRRSGGASTIVLVVLLVLGLLFLAGWLLCSVLGTRAPSSSAPSRRTSVVAVSAQAPWQSTGIYVRQGQVVSIAYLDGTWGVWGGPRGPRNQTDAEGFDGEHRSAGLPMTSVPVGALLGRIGDEAPFLVGQGIRFRTGESGVLRLSINDQWLDDNTGAVRVEVKVTSAR